MLPQGHQGTFFFFLLISSGQFHPAAAVCCPVYLFTYLFWMLSSCGSSSMLLFYAGGAFSLFTYSHKLSTLSLVNLLVQAQRIPKLIPHRDIPINIS